MEAVFYAEQAVLDAPGFVYPTGPFASFRRPTLHPEMKQAIHRCVEELDIVFETRRETKRVKLR